MAEGPASGIERAVLGASRAEEVDGWLDEHLRARLGTAVSRILFRSGRVAAVWGAALADGRRVVVKAHRAGVDLDHLCAAVACQRRLADAGYPCPRPVDGPDATGGVTAIVETLLDVGGPGDAHDARTRRAMVTALAWQRRLLRGAPVEPLRAGAPAWAQYREGPWPVPHDPIFDFSSTPGEYAWVDETAEHAASVLRAHAWEGCVVVGHVDWNCANLRFDGGGVSAAYDWDSLAAAPEPVLVGLAAGGFTAGSSTGASAPSPEDVVAFVHDYEATRDLPFGAAERQAAGAAATWVLAYNARCLVSVLARGDVPPEGSPLHALGARGDEYLSLAW